MSRLTATQAALVDAITADMEREVHRLLDRAAAAQARSRRWLDRGFGDLATIDCNQAAWFLARARLTIEQASAAIDREAQHAG